MKLYKKVLVGVIALSMVATFMSGCSSKDNADGNVGDSSASNTDASSTETEETSLPDNIDYTDEITDGVIMTVGGYDIDVEEYRYYFLNLKQSFDGGDDSYWDGEAIEGTDESGNDVSQTVEESRRERLSSLKDYVTTYLINNYCVELMAKDYNIELTADELKKVEDTYNETKESYESDETAQFDTFEDYLTSTYCTKDLYLKSITRQALEEKVVRTLYEEDFRENLLPEYNHVQHILFSTTGLTAETEEVPDDATDDEKAKIEAANEEATNKSKEEVKAKAEEVLQKIKDGADFEEMIAEYNEDTGETVAEDGSVEGYYFKEGTMVTEFEDAFFALDENEVSDIVETTYGYHIIKRLPIDEEYIEKNLLSMIMYDMSTGETTEYYDQYMELADSYYDAMEVTYSDDYYNINTASIPVKSSTFPYVEVPSTEAE